MNKEDKILKTLTELLIFFLVCLDVGAVVLIIDILQYSLTLMILIAALVISLNVSLISMVVEIRRN